MGEGQGCRVANRRQFIKCLNLDDRERIEGLPLTEMVRAAERGERVYLANSAGDIITAIENRQERELTEDERAWL